MSYAVHPLAALIPEMSADQFAELRADIQQHGLIEPITLHEHMVLDGRHRLCACEETGVEARFEDFNGPSPVEFVLSKNLKRRHLTPGQLAAIGLAFKPAIEAENQARKAAAAKAQQGSGGRFTSVGDPPITNGEKSRETVGRLVGVSGATIDRAQRIQREDPDMFDQVKAGTLTVTAADTAIREREQQRTPRVMNPIKQRHMPAAGQIIPKILAALRVQAKELERALSDGTVQIGEVADWSRDLSDVMRSLRASNNRLKEQV